MKWLNCGVVLVAVVILLCFGQPVKASDTSVLWCHQPDILYSYLDDIIIRHNRTYSYVDVKSMLYPVMDLMLGWGDSGFSETNHDLMVFWIRECSRAENSEQEMEALKALARQIDHRLHTNQSVYKFSTLLFGDRMGRWLMNPHLKALDLGDLDADALWNCEHELADEYGDAAQHVWKDYVYISHPLHEPY